MKKLFVLFLILSPIQLWAENSILDKYITITDNIITANVMSAAKELSFDKSIAKKYTAAGNTLEIEMNKDIGLLLSCNPTKNNIVKGTVIREKESKRIKAFKCGGMWI